jgi:Transposase IS66 family
MAEVATPTAARFPLAVKQLLEEGLAMRDRYLEQQISLRGLWTATGRLEAKLDRLLARTYQDPANRRLAKHLRHERPYLFTFLYCPGLVDATNNLAERVMRMLVVIRKNWGGNRTGDGARAQAILASVLCTARQQDKDVFELLTDLLRSPQPKLLDILPEVEAVTGSNRVDAVAAGGRAAGGGPAADGMAEMRLPDVSGLQGWRPSTETRPLFSSA